MITKIMKPAQSALASVAYNENKVLRTDDVSLFLTHNMEGESRAEIEFAFLNLERNPAVDCKMRNFGMHSVFSLGPEDNPDDPTTEERMTDYIKEWAERMGYGDQPYAVYRHQDTGHKHFHFVSTRVNEEGQKIDDSFEKRRDLELLIELAPKYGFLPGDGTVLLEKDERRRRNEEKKAQREESARQRERELGYPEPDRFCIKKGNVMEQFRGFFEEALTYNFTTLHQFTAIMESRGVAVRQASLKGEDRESLVFKGLTKKGNDVTKLYTESEIGVDAMKLFQERLEQNKAEHEILHREKVRVDNIAGRLFEWSTSRQHFERMLRSKGIDMVFSYAEKDPSRLIGLTFIDHTVKTAFKSSELGKAPGVAEIEKAYETGKWKVEDTSRDVVHDNELLTPKQNETLTLDIKTALAVLGHRTDTMRNTSGNQTGNLNEKVYQEKRAEEKMCELEQKLSVQENDSKDDKSSSDNTAPQPSSKQGISKVIRPKVQNVPVKHEIHVSQPNSQLAELESVPVVPRTWLEISANGVAYDMLNVEENKKSYEQRLKDAERFVEQAIHAKFDHAFRKAKIENIKILEIGEKVKAKADVQIPGELYSLSKEISIPFSGRDFEHAEFRDVIHNEVNYRRNGIFPNNLVKELRETKVEILFNEKYNVAFNSDTFKGIEATALATPYGKQYLLMAEYNTDRYTKETAYFLSEPQKDGVYLDDLVYFDKKGNQYDIDVIKRATDEISYSRQRKKYFARPAKRFQIREGNIMDQFRGLFNEALTYNFTSMDQFAAIMKSRGVVVMQAHLKGEDKKSLVFKGLTKKGNDATKLYTESELGVDAMKLFQERLRRNIKANKDFKSEKETLEKTVAKLFEWSTSRQHFERMLRSKRIDVVFSYACNDPSYLIGLTFIDHTSKTTFRSSELDKASIMAEIREAYETGKWEIEDSFNDVVHDFELSTSESDDTFKEYLAMAISILCQTTNTIQETHGNPVVDNYCKKARKERELEEKINELKQKLGRSL